MNKVYRHHAFARDEYLGRVGGDGRVYDSRFGPDRYIGRVELEDGKIYESRLGPDQYIGHVEVQSGKVYLDKFGPDYYLGKVTEDGKLYRHKPVAPDEYLGKVTEMVSVLHGGAAFLLLVAPAYDQEKEANEASETSGNEAETGGAPAEA